MKKKQITLRDIASELNISVATVSRAIRDTHDVSSQTKELVLAKLKEHNYRMNYAARGLSSQKSGAIGVIIPAINNYYFSTVFLGIKDVAYKHGFHVMLYITDDSYEREVAIANSISISAVDGLIVCVMKGEGNDGHFRNIMDLGVPIVFFDRVIESIHTSKVTQNDYEGAFAGTSHLINKGYKKIAHITGPLDLLLSKERLRGYKDALRKHGIAVKDNLIISSGFSQSDGIMDTEYLWNKKIMPDAIFAVNDRKAIGAVIALKNKNIAIGKTVGVLGFTNDPVCSLITPTLSTIAEPAYEVGEMSCTLLLKHIKKPNFIPESISLDCTLIERESTQRY